MDEVADALVDKRTVSDLMSPIRLALGGTWGGRREKSPRSARLYSRQKCPNKAAWLSVSFGRDEQASREIFFACFCTRKGPQINDKTASGAGHASH